jgi:hypothetical protein
MAELICHFQSASRALPFNAHSLRICIYISIKKIFE